MIDFIPACPSLCLEFNSIAPISYFLSVFVLIGWIQKMQKMMIFCQTKPYLILEELQKFIWSMFWYKKHHAQFLSQEMDHNSIHGPPHKSKPPPLVRTRGPIFTGNRLFSSTSYVIATGYFHQHHIYWQQVFFHTFFSYFHWLEKIIKINSPQIYTRIFYHKQHHFSLIQLHLSHTFFRFWADL